MQISIHFTNKGTHIFTTYTHNILCIIFQNYKYASDGWFRKSFFFVFLIGTFHLEHQKYIFFLYFGMNENLIILFLNNFQ